MLTFAAAGAVYWTATLVMLVAATIGGYLGAQVGRRAPPQLIHGGSVLLTAGITVMFFIRAYS